MVSRILVVSLLTVLLASAAWCQTATKVPEPATANPVVIASPNGGEMWEVGTPQKITWAVSDKYAVDSVRIRLLGKGVVKEGGTTPVVPKPVVLAMLAGNPGAWDWSKPGPIGVGYTIEVTAYCPKVKPIKDVSDKPFSIVAAAATPVPMPSVVSIVTPNGGEKWLIGSTHSIGWTIQLPDPAVPVPAVAEIAVTLSRDGGKTFKEVLVDRLPMTVKDYSWIIKGPTADHCRVKVVLSLGTKSYEDFSNDDFLIISDKAQPGPQGEGQK